MRIAIYDQATGEVKRVITCGTVEQGQQNVGDGEAAVQIGLNDDDSTIYIDQGAAMPMPARPSAAHAFDWVAKQWYDPRTLNDFKALKWAEIKRTREEVIDGGFVWDASSFDSDFQSRSNIQGAVQMALLAKDAGQPYSVTWTLADNSLRVLTRAEVFALGQALVAHVNTQHDRARTRRQEIMVATTVQEVLAVVW